MSENGKGSKTPKKGIHKGLKVFLGLVGALFLALLLFVGVLLLIPAFERRADAAGEHAGADWMAALQDDRKLSEIRIPGAHDCATEFVQLAFVARCQQNSIGELLEDGFRYLDIRLAAEGGSDGTKRLRFMHGPTKCKTGFWPWESTLFLEDVLADCYAFLEAHPGETILFVVKKESGSESVREFQEILDRYVSGKKDKWYLSDGEIPTLGEARGKIVLFRRYEDEAGLGAEAGLPILWTDQGNKDRTELNYAYEDNSFYKLAVKDRYKYGNEDKWAAFTAKPAEASDVQVSFLSTAGSWIIGHPFGHAKELDAKLLALPAEDLPEGWIIIDFGTAETAQHIYQAN